MTEPNDNLERLVSRYLDQECSDEERRELQALLRRDQDAASLVDDYADFDRELNYALKGAMGRPPVRRRVVAGWALVRRGVGFGIAATVAAFLWYSPALRPHLGRAGASSGPPVNAASWFAPPPAGGDVLVDDTSQFERQQVRLDKDDRNWIVVPGDRPGEFMVVEVKKIRTRTIPLQDDL